MRTKFLLTLLLALTIIDAGRTQTPEPFGGNIILGRPTDRSITVNITFTSDQDSVYLEYGDKSGALSKQTPVRQGIKANMPYQEVITGLNPDQRCYYRVRNKKLPQDPFGASEEHSFHTRRAPGSTYTFCIQGDSHPERASQFDSDLYIRTLRTVAADQPDFYMTIGDDFSVDTLKTVNAATVAERYTLQLPYFGLVAHSAPLFLVNGNHEQAARYLLDGTPNNVAVWAQNARNLYYAQPAPDGFYTGNTEDVPHIGLLRNYYAWEWGDALFVTIDPYWSSPVPVDNVFGGTPKTANKWDITHGDAQYQWLKRTLESSKARWKFVFAHHVVGTGRGAIELAPYYEWGGKNQNGSWGFTANRPGWELPIHQLMVKNGVTIFFQGHDHLFVRQQLDGVTYQELPEPADPTYTLWNDDAYESGDKFSNTGYVRVNVSPSLLRVEYVRTFLPKDEKPPAQVNGMVQFSYTIPAAEDRTKVSLSIPAGGSAAASTSANEGALQVGYAAAILSSGSAPYGTAVFSISQEGIVVSEAAVPASPPTTAARIFVDYATRVPSGPANLRAGPVDIYTGIAAVNRGTAAANVTYTLRDMQGQTLSVGHGTLAPGAHRARFLHQLQVLAPDFVLPANFAAATRFGSLEIAGDQPLSIIALRMTVNQRGNSLLTTIPVADLSQKLSSSPVFFPHVADGDGYLSTFILLNTSNNPQSGLLRFFGDDGTPLTVRQVDGNADSTFHYTIPSGGTYLFQSDGFPATAQDGSLQLTPDPGSTSPVGAGIFSRTSNGFLETESGIPAAIPTTHARVYVDMADGHDSGLAIAGTTSTTLPVTLKAYQSDGSTPAGSQANTLPIPGNGHAAAFIRQWVSGLPANFKGVLDISAPALFAALTLRALTNARQDFLITTFPIADLNRPAPAPLVFPQIADGGGYRTEFILLSSGDSAASIVSFFGEEGTPLAVGSSSAVFGLHSPVVEEGGALPVRFTCDGTANTLPLTWSNEPAGTQSFAVIMHTVAPDAIHWYWLVWDIPATVHTLPENMTGIGTLGSNSVNNKGGYSPPCSQGPGAKTYTYTVYALSSPPQLSGPPLSVTRDALLRAISDRTLGSAVLNVTYSRP